MNFDYEPMSEDEATKARYQLLPDGIYEAYVLNSIPKLSNSNNSMAQLDLLVYDEDGKEHPKKDFLVFTPKMMWKIKHFCDSAGLQKEYEDKKFHPDMAKNMNVFVKITSQIGKEIPLDKLNGQPPGSKYQDKNVIDDYVVSDGKKTQPTNNSEAQASAFDDEIPF